jgi:membrane protein
VLALINARVRDLVERPSPSLGLGLAISTTIALWTATTGTKAMLSALNFAYDETEHRGILTLQLVAIAITLSAIMVAVITLAVLVVVPALVSFVGLSAYSQGLLRLIALLLLLGAVMLSLSTLYRYGPSRHRARWRWVRPGAGLATGLWLVASVLFSEYVARIAGYDATYGPLAAAVGVMMWLWVSVYVVLLGAQLNAELELLIVPHRT